MKTVCTLPNQEQQASVGVAGQQQLEIAARSRSLRDAMQQSADNEVRREYTQEIRLATSHYATFYDLACPAVDARPRS